MEDNIVAILALDADASGIFSPGALDKQLWTMAINQPDVLTNENWLLAYEANHQGWLASKPMLADPIFSAMSRAGVSFYDRRRNFAQYPAAARGMAGGALADHYA